MLPRVPRQRGEAQAGKSGSAPSRHIPIDVRRAVVERDGARCSYVDERGERCRETRLLELHHEQPFARGGRATVDNIFLRCRAHNALAAEDDFGREFMRARQPLRAESMRDGGR